MYISPLHKKYPKSDPNEPNWRRPIFAMLVLVFILALLPFVYTGTFSRYQADDYCFSSSLIQNGYLGALWDNYSTWSNRFSTVMVIGLIDPLKVFGMQILPGILVSAMFAGIVLLFTQLRKLFGWLIGLPEIIILVSMVTFFTIYTAPDQFQSFYWRSGSVTYTLPVVLLPFILSLIVHFARNNLMSRSSFLPAILIFILALINGGFSETTAAFQAAVFGLIFIGIVLRPSLENSKSFKVLLISAVAGIVLAMVIMILSPGNAVRLQNMPETPGLFKLVYLSLRFGAGFLVNTVTDSPLPLIISSVTAFALAFLGKWNHLPNKKLNWMFWVIPVSAFILVVAVCAPSAYAQSAYAEARAFLPARWILTIAGIAWFYLLGIKYQQWYLNRPKSNIKKAQSLVAVLIVLLCFYPMRVMLITLGDIPNFEARAKAWDERAAIIEQERSLGHLEIEVQAMDSYGRIRELSDIPNLWVNRCAAIYYGVEKITAK